MEDSLKRKNNFNIPNFSSVSGLSAAFKVSFDLYNYLKEDLYFCFQASLLLDYLNYSYILINVQSPQYKYSVH